MTNPYSAEEVLASLHVDPDFELKYGFCRESCEECDRLDREQFGQPQSEVLAQGVTMALIAIREVPDGQP